MKIVLSKTLVALLAIGLVGINNNSINNTFAQESFEPEDLVNETLDSGNTNDSFWESNATLAFAQDSSLTPEVMNNTMENDTSMVMNATLPLNIINKNDTSYNPTE